MSVSQPDHEHVPWLAEVLGIGWFERQIAAQLDTIEARLDSIDAQLAVNIADQAALAEARNILEAADATIDSIEPGP